MLNTDKKVWRKINHNQYLMPTQRSKTTTSHMVSGDLLRTHCERGQFRWQIGVTAHQIILTSCQQDHASAVCLTTIDQNLQRLPCLFLTVVVYQAWCQINNSEQGSTHWSCLPMVNLRQDPQFNLNHTCLCLNNSPSLWGQNLK